MAKFFSQNTIIGQKGVAVFEKRLLDIGGVWTPSTLDAGLDGYVELRDPHTGEALNQILPAQIKSTTASLLKEGEQSFQFRCESRDIEYWMKGNAPVILVVVRLDEDEVYWVSVKEQFADPKRRSSGVADFDKTKDALDGGAFERLLHLASPAGGVDLAPAPTSETLYSNLLPLRGLPPLVYVAETEFRSRRELWHAVETPEGLGNAWFVKESKIYSFHDLDTPMWSSYCDPGSIEAIEVEHWSRASDPDLKRDFVHLLNLALTQRLDLHRIRWHNRAKLYYFLPSDDEHLGRLFKYRGRSTQTSREVVKSKRKSGGREGFIWVRHEALYASFERLEDEWYLLIEPTYHFTFDGWRTHRGAGELISGKKEHDRNESVLGQVIMWSRILGGTPSTPRLDLESEYLLAFDELVTFELNVGLDDDLWLSPPGQESAGKPPSARQLQEEIFLVD